MLLTHLRARLIFSEAQAAQKPSRSRRVMHAKYLNRCFQLAQTGETHAYPNPIVGCVIVHEDQIIAEGFHQRYGGPHAEVNAINSLLSKHREPELKQIFSETTIYVSLEPCSHFGKTPPCSDLIIKHRPKALVYACQDPNPLVSGKGIQAIKDSGIEVISPLQLAADLVKQAEYLNRVFFDSLNHPHWITAKIAVTETGLMIPHQDEPQLQRSNPTDRGGWISNQESRKRAHRLRSTHQCLITSIRTIINDNPEFNVRYKAQDLGLAEIKDPDIIILKHRSDFTKTERTNLKIFSQGRNIIERSLGQDYKDLSGLVDTLKPGKILIEAGPSLTAAFIQEELVNELVIYQKLSKEQYETIKPGLYASLPAHIPNNALLDIYLQKHSIKYCHLDFCHSDESLIPDLELTITRS